MNKKTTSIFYATLILLTGIVLGALVTDSVRLFGLTHDKYLIAFSEEQTPENLAKCIRRGVIYGQNYSVWSTELGHPEYCLIEAEATPLQDGGIAVFPATKTWYGRFVDSRAPTIFSKDQIKEFALSSHSYDELP